jgi:hypothetical protein
MHGGCRGLLFTGAAYLFVMFLVLPLLSLLVTGLWLWTSAELLLSALALSLLWGLLWGTANFWRARRALAQGTI